MSDFIYLSVFSYIGWLFIVADGLFGSRLFIYAYQLLYHFIVCMVSFLVYYITYCDNDAENEIILYSNFILIED